MLVSSEAEGKVLVVKDKSEWASIFHEVAAVEYAPPPLTAPPSLPTSVASIDSDNESGSPSN